MVKIIIVVVILEIIIININILVDIIKLYILEYCKKCLENINIILL